MFLGSYKYNYVFDSAKFVRIFFPTPSAASSLRWLGFLLLLAVIKLSIVAIEAHKLFMRTLFNDLAILYHDYQLKKEKRLPLLEEPGVVNQQLRNYCLGCMT